MSLRPDGIVTIVMVKIGDHNRLVAQNVHDAELYPGQLSTVDTYIESDMIYH